MTVIDATKIHKIEFSKPELEDYTKRVIQKDEEYETLNLLVGRFQDGVAKVRQTVQIQKANKENKDPKGSLVIDDDIVRSTVKRYENYSLLGIMHHHCYETEERPAEVTKNITDKETYPTLCMPGWGDVYTEIYEEAIGFEHAKLARIILGTSKNQWNKDLAKIYVFAYHLMEDCKKEKAEKLRKKIENKAGFEEFKKKFMEKKFLREETEKLYQKELHKKMRTIEITPKVYYVQLQPHLTKLKT